jgi:membrane protease YdiL (CAAX protease family)
MDPTEAHKKELPFNNLYLNAGYVNGFNHWWMYVCTVLLVALGYVVFGSACTLPLYGKALAKGITQKEIEENTSILFNGDLLGIDKNIILLLEFGMFVFAAIGFVIGIRRIHKKTLTGVLTAYEKFRFKRFWTAFGIWGTLLAVVVVANYFISPGDMELNFQPAGFFISLLIMVIFMPIQTGIEELIFRGYMIQGLSQIFRNGIIPLIITSFLFGLAHMSNPEVHQFGWPIMLTYYVFFAFFMGGITLIDEGLELAFGIHFANNIISSVLITSPHSVIKTYAIFEAKAENPMAEIVLWTCMAAVTFTIFWLIYRWKNFNLIIK